MLCRITYAAKSEDGKVGGTTDTRQRMVTSAALLLREKGVAGTSVAAVLAHSNGPRGSVGHHFPGGRTELLVDGLRWAAEQVTGALAKARDRGDSPAEVFAMFCGFYRRQLLETGFAAGCPVGATAQEAYDDPALGPVVAEIMAGWVTALADVLVEAGRERDEAVELATLCLSALEGALLVARVERSARPVEIIEQRLTPLL